VVRHEVAHTLENHQRPIKEAFVVEFNDKQFWRDVVLIEDEPLAHELEWQSGEKDEVGRIAGLDDRKPAFAVNLEEKVEFMEQRRCIFAKVSHRAPPLRRQRMPVNRNVVDDLEALRKVDVERADHRHRPAGAMEGLRLLPNPSIEGDRQIFNDNDTGAGLTRGRH
jgi:hypothetical protein